MQLCWWSFTLQISNFASCSHQLPLFTKQIYAFSVGLHKSRHQSNICLSKCHWKKRSEETQTLGAGCSKAESIFFYPPQTPFPGMRDCQNLISWRWPLPLPTNPVWWGLMHAISSYRGNRPTHTHTHTQVTIHCAAAS